MEMAVVDVRQRHLRSLSKHIAMSRQEVGAWVIPEMLNRGQESQTVELNHCRGRPRVAPINDSAVQELSGQKDDRSEMRNYASAAVVKSCFMCAGMHSGLLVNK